MRVLILLMCILKGFFVEKGVCLGLQTVLYEFEHSFFPHYAVL